MLCQGWDLEVVVSFETPENENFTILKYKSLKRTKNNAFSGRWPMEV